MVGSAKALAMFSYVMLNGTIDEHPTFPAPTFGMLSGHDGCPWHASRRHSGRHRYFSGAMTTAKFFTSMTWNSGQAHCVR
jgi:hypothetical protein